MSNQKEVGYGSCGICLRNAARGYSEGDASLLLDPLASLEFTQSGPDCKRPCTLDHMDDTTHNSNDQITQPCLHLNFR